MMRQNMKRLAIGFGLMLGTALPALAAPGFATGNVNLRAGPGTGYPEVVVVPNRAPVEIFGCLQGYSWCDVGFDGVRGWVSSGYLQYSYQGHRVPFARYYGRAGVPVVGFQFGNYWGEHYRDRPWFTDRDRWGRPGQGGPGYGPAGGREPGWGRRLIQGPDRGPGFDRGPGELDSGPRFDRGPGGPDRGLDRDPREFRGQR